MDKFEKSQILKLSLIALLFLITPLLSASMRPHYLYFLLNLVIIAVGIQAGFFSFLMPPEDKKPQANVGVIPKEVEDFVPSEASNNKDATSILPKVDVPETGRYVKMVQKSRSEKIVSLVEENILKKCPSMPNLFFIGSGEEVGELLEEEEEDEEVEGSLSGQELFTKAETFIGNFYKQLKIQREDSWNKIHGSISRPFK
ncbi:hypothetical protein GIB67_032162 [Kingdonia uniflora]|uniref:DUF4408 domain-containing protein n=1 Tax=Kingdonia uniflora TaxID=39325 RepID=A0A7J7MWS7_9MAGN|nr:hypothetical protein GIB67_032162 [Kingdonia uniflora]